jgi:hypothetical protein
LKAVSGDVGLGRPDDPLLFLGADGVFGRVGVPAGFDFDEDERVAVPGDDVDFAGFRAVGRGHDTVTMRPKMVESEDLRSAAEGEQTVEEEWKRHQTLNGELATKSTKAQKKNSF